MSVVRGRSGRLVFSREWPEPRVLTERELKTAGGITYLLTRDDAWWTGMRVLLCCDRGVPLVDPETGWAPCPGGYRFWGGQGVAGPVTGHRTGPAGPFWSQTIGGAYANGGYLCQTGLSSGDYGNGDYQDGNGVSICSGGSPVIGTTAYSNGEAELAITETTGSVLFWESAMTVGLRKSQVAYIRRDELDRLSFYASEEGAIAADPSQRIELLPLAFGAVVLCASTEAPVFEAAMVAAAADALDARPAGECPLAELTTIPSAYLEVAADPAQREWHALGTCTRWVLETDPAMIDTSAIGEDFGESVKDVVRGAGSFSTMLPRPRTPAGAFDARGFMRLACLTATGARARALLVVQQPEPNSIYQNEEYLWYECDILIGRGSMDVSADALIPLQSDFVVVKDKNGQGIVPRVGQLTAA